jgi:hypothetical protein
MRRRLLPIFAAVSVLLLGCAVVQWAGWAERAACVGSNRVAEDTSTSLVVDDETVQLGRGGLWVGRCRVAILAPLGRRDVEKNLDDFLALTRRLNVFNIENLSPPLAGFGQQRGSVVEPIGVGFLVYELDGYLVPHWVLALVAGVLPVAWVVRRLRRRRAGAVGGGGRAEPRPTPDPARLSGSRSS